MFAMATYNLREYQKSVNSVTDVLVHDVQITKICEALLNFKFLVYFLFLIFLLLI